MDISINYSGKIYNYSKNTIDKKHYKIYVSNKFNYVNYDDFIKNSEINFLGVNKKVIPITDINSINEVTVYFALMILINGGIYNNKTGKVISSPLEIPSFLGWYVVEFDEPFYVENIKYTKDIFSPLELTKIN